MTIYALGWFWAAVAGCSAAVIVYTILVRRLAELVQPFRLAIADRGIVQLSSNIADSDKQVVQFMMTHAFRMWPAAMLVIFLPIETVSLIWVKMVGREPPKGAPNRECAIIARHFLISTLAANPIAAVILVVEMMTFGFVAFLVGGHLLVSKALFESQRVEAKTPFVRPFSAAA